MNTHWKSLLAAALFCVSATGLAARASAPAHLTDLAWLAGVWHAHALGGEVEDVYQPQSAHEIVGTSRLIIHGHTQRYELRRISTQHDEIVYQELAFDDAFMAAPPVPEQALLSTGAGRARFHNLLLRRTGANSMDVTWLRTDRNGRTRTEVIHYTRILRFRPTEPVSNPAPGAEE